MTTLPTTADCAQWAQAAYVADPKWRVDERIRACLFKVGDTAIVATPGTDPLYVEDVMHDLDADPIDVPGLGLIHHGFADCFVPLYALMRTELLRDPAIARVIFVGHSLGGAQAVGLAALWTRDGGKPCAFVTFGCPHVGTKTLARLLDPVPGYMHWFGVDPVPFVPMFWIQAPRPVIYEHPKPQIHIGKPGFPWIAGNHLMVHYQTATPAVPVFAKELVPA